MFICDSNKLTIRQLNWYFTAAPGDYGNLTDVAVTFQPSDTSLQVQVLINDDSILESEENFFGRLVAQNPSIVNIFAPTATVSITDDDGM